MNQSQTPLETGTAISLSDILSERSLYSYVQSIRDLKRQTTYGHEVLVRGPSDSLWHRPDQLFIAAQSQQLSRQLEIVILEVHLENIAAHTYIGCYTVNLAPNLLLDKTVFQILNRYVLAERIKIELTEHLPIRDWQPIKQRIAQLRKQGYQFWLDDVGCGFFDLALIDEVKPEVVKLCIKIISRLTFDPTLVDEIKAVVKAVHDYGGAVLAEGIEEQVQLDMAEQLNIDLAQGYLFDKPQPLI
ncbi:EAL domain-containing protein [Vibrio kanaloae]|uniref:EAL domain-containing protein n=1 Tax=Vibrio kanaloae TaxID=170673 RepID=UPI0010BD5B46|nr:EAL domain-containing protein [Vibrio kanaloae]TKF03554.1 EAL domain-containing protein [Vibrio kanaloae]TKF56980.1 EAL domain-containing protein [Vibrio kanaloae]